MRTVVKSAIASLLIITFVAGANFVDFRYQSGVLALFTSADDGGGDGGAGDGGDGGGGSDGGGGGGEGGADGGDGDGGGAGGAGDGGSPADGGADGGDGGGAGGAGTEGPGCCSDPGGSDPGVDGGGPGGAGDGGSPADGGADGGGPGGAGEEGPGCCSDPGGNDPGYNDDNGGDSTPTPTPVPPPICVLSAHPNVITLGQESQLSWQAGNAVSASINQGVGSVALGDRSIRLTPGLGTHTYTMVVHGIDGSTVSCSTAITVTQPPVEAQPFTCAANVTMSLSSQTITRGGTATLFWNVTGATSVRINQGIGNVNLEGNIQVSPTQNTTYTLIATDSQSRQVTCTTSITVTQPPVTPQPFTCTNNVTFTASPSRIDRGDSSTLRWNVTGATNVSINNGVNTNGALSGSAVVSPRSNTTYTLTATFGTSSIPCPITIDVDSDSGSSSGSSPLRCELTASDRSIRRGDRVTLKWETTRATEIELRDNHNRVIVTTEDRSSREKQDLYDDSIVVRPDRDTTYTLTASRGSRERECTVRINVDDDVTITEIRDQQPLVVSIPLTSVPYTGLDAKEVAQLSVLGLLALWGAYLAWSAHQRRKMAVVQK